MEFSLLWAALTGAAAAWAGTRLWPDRLPPKPSDLLIGSAALGLLVGRLAAMLAQGINPLGDPLQILLVRGGVDTGLATVGALVALAWVLRTRLSTFDALAPAALLGLAGWHAGCLWRSACLGTASDLPWAWAQPDSAIGRHPVEIYAAIALAMAAFAIGRLPWRPLFRSGAALATAGAVRLATEPMRHTITGGPVEWYVAGIAVGLGMVVAGPAILRRVRTAPT